ncbi:hypothetical protein ABZ816_31965 [Actinosynnema sp. NPDC047251]|uniref:Secreted protein n=1 Tax=Saccharothrix espanaensis (strain ATCC 51144 / DSM 44229 / JCM 9112 / NBRC 15066 / NRRL 15764) TaxID=1179773 RepID=K0K0D1_SACES|nr:hypothetical protein [Saccharothrix espanaensis]CCH30003.1 hypothetical protein BN6_26910 [Saccharothrix espanaensis DSM 44229]
MRTVVFLSLVALSVAACSSSTPSVGPPSSTAPTTGPGVYRAPSPITSTCVDHLGYEAVEDRFGKPVDEPRTTSNDTNLVSCNQLLSGAEYPEGFAVTDLVFEADVEKARARYAKAKETVDPEIGDVHPLPGYGDQAHWLRHGDGVGARTGQFQVRVQRSNVLITVRVSVGPTGGFTEARTAALRDATAQFADATLKGLPTR